eukprot:117648_1
MGCCLPKQTSNINNNSNKKKQDGKKSEKEPPRIDMEAALSANMVRFSQDFSPINEGNITPMGDDTYKLPKLHPNMGDIPIYTHSDTLTIPNNHSHHNDQNNNHSKTNNNVQPVQVNTVTVNINTNINTLETECSDPDILEIDYSHEISPESDKYVWKLNIHFDKKNNDIILNISEDTKNRQWIKRLTNNELSVDTEVMYHEYMKLRKANDKGKIKYALTNNGKCTLTFYVGDDIYEFVSE